VKKHRLEELAAKDIAGTMPVPGGSAITPRSAPRKSFSTPVHVPKPTLHLAVFGLWFAAIAWFHPILSSVLEIATGSASWAALAFFVVFTQVAWLYASYNLCVLAFAIIYKRRRTAPAEVPLPAEIPAVALLYTTCNDFVEQSLLSCLRQDYSKFSLYILDDSSDPEYKAKVDAFAARHTDRVRVVRRPNRRGFKAGNLNHGLSQAAFAEPFFALVDADEILPRDFISRLVPRMLAEERCGFIQANHKSNPTNPAPLSQAMGPGIDSHWRWYQPLRNDYGFVMLLGHGALIRRQAWIDAGGFPEIVSEDLAFALAAREQGWHGRFAEDVVCFEDFPETVRAFRVRHMKWTRGTCEFLSRLLWPLLKSRNIPLVEKIDVLLPTLNLPLALLFFLFVIDTNFVLTGMFGHSEVMTIETGIAPLTVNALQMDSAFSALHRADLFVITILTLVAPVLCFIIDMWRTPVKLFGFLGRSTALYGALGPLSSIGVLLFSVTGKAVFHVTADRGSGQSGARNAGGQPTLARFWEGIKVFAGRSHPDHWGVQIFEVACGLLFAWAAWQSFQVAFFGLALALLLFPILHHTVWENRAVQVLTMVPMVLILLGLAVNSMAFVGMQTMFFGFGFHF
jgi:cellulose synthase/poly-beta-1,6-N-acetylglucosamine synthase-like glycosyltransferase